ncbi:MAG TPA: 2-oxoacid:ferredoxin oxidoreductase subunit beta, partial [Geobacteraceae bacterium]
LVEILDDCPTTYGRRNRYKSVIEMMNHLKEVSVPIKAAERMTPEQLQGKILTGILYKEEKPEYCEQYQKVIERAQSGAK